MGPVAGAKEMHRSAVLSGSFSDFCLPWNLEATGRRDRRHIGHRTAAKLPAGSGFFRSGFWERACYLETMVYIRPHAGRASRA